MTNTPATIRVTLLTQGDCALCDRAKSVLKNVAADYPLELRELPLDSQEGHSLALQNGVLFPPGILLDDQRFSHGRVSERRLRKELDSRTATTC